MGFLRVVQFPPTSQKCVSSYTKSPHMNVCDHGVLIDWHLILGVFAPTLVPSRFTATLNRWLLKMNEWTNSLGTAKSVCKLLYISTVMQLWDYTTGYLKRESFISVFIATFHSWIRTTFLMYNLKSFTIKPNGKILVTKH